MAQQDRYSSETGELLGVQPFPSRHLTSPPILTIIAERGLHHRSGLKRLHNEVSEYPVVAEIRNEYMQELHTWIGNGWLVPYPENKLRPPKGLIPLMAVLQQTKTKVHPVMNYWELNHHVDTFTTNVCTAKLREW